MAKKKQGYRTMGTRSVSVTLTFSVKSACNMTDSAWETIESRLEAVVEQVTKRTILTCPEYVEPVYNRQVEVRDPYSLP